MHMPHGNRKGFNKKVLEVNDPRSQPHQVNFESYVSLGEETECVYLVEDMRSCGLVKAEVSVSNPS